MYTTTKTIHTETSHRLMLHRGQCHNLHGHTYRWDVSVSRETLSDSDMVIDFADLKSLMCNIIENSFDHAVVLNSKDELAEDLLLHGLNVFRMNGDPTAENMAEVAFHLIDKELEDMYGAMTPRPFVSSVTVHETKNSNATYVLPGAAQVVVLPEVEGTDGDSNEH